MKELKTLSLLFIFSICFSYLYSQEVSFKTYSVQDGLVANPVRRIFQDSKGFIWIATWEGLSKYDGYKFTNFTTANGLSHNLVNDLFEADGKIYVAENNGCIDVIQDDRIQKAFIARSAVNHFLSLKNGSILLTTDDNGVYEFSKGRFYRPEQKIDGLTCGEIIQLNDSLLLGHTSNWGLQFITNDYKLFSKSVFHDLDFSSLYKDSKNRTWVCTSKGLKLLSPTIRTHEPPHFAPLPASFNVPEITQPIVTDILEDPDGGFWIGTLQGLVRLEASGRVQVYTGKNGLPSSAVGTILRDRENNIWFGTALGLAKFVSKNQVHVFKDNGVFKNDISGIIHMDNNDLLLTTGHGIQQYKNLTNTFLDLAHPDNDSTLAFVQGSKPLLFYFGNTFGKLNADNRFVTLRNLAKFSPSDYYSCTDSLGNSFVANHKGIAVLSKKNWYVDTTVPYRISSLAIDNKGYLWAGTWENGLFRIQYSPDGSSVNFSVQDFSYLVHSKHIRSLFPDSKGSIWVGTRYDGAFCLTPQTRDQYSAMQFEKHQGLISNFVTAFAESSKGDIWVGSYLGLDKLVKEKSSFRVFNFSKVTNFFAHILGIVPAGGNKWYCHANSGLTIFTDEELENAPAMQVHILSVFLGSKDTITRVAPNAIIVLKHFQNQAKFEFSALGFINEKQILYSYRLGGRGNEVWSEPQNIHEVSYASLSPGNYSFEVRTVGWNLQPGKPASFSFTIEPPFWKTAWFIALCILFFGFILYALYRYRINQLVRVQKVRNRIATDLHDDIGSALTTISVLSELSDKNLADQKLAKQYIHRISEEVNASGQALDDIIWSVNSSNDSLDEMMIRMRRFAAELFDHTNTHCQLQLQPAATGIKIGMEQRRDLYLVFKETLNNIYKHAAAKNVKVELSILDHFLKLTIKDDGHGFDTSQLTHRNGLKNLKTRVDKWKGKINIESHPEKGTLINIMMSIHN